MARHTIRRRRLATLSVVSAVTIVLLALAGGLEGMLKFIRFRPPELQGASFPHIRLDRTLEFLIGDRLA